MQVADATVHPDTLIGMDEADLLLWRIARLQAAIDEFFGGSLADFARKMGWRDGSYAGQMLRGDRAISEKTIRKIEATIGHPGWFDPENEATGGSKSEVIRRELLVREVPDHVLQTFLEVLRQFPSRQTGT